MCSNVSESTREHTQKNLLKCFVEHSMNFNLSLGYFDAPAVALFIRLAAIDHCGTVNP